MLNTILPLLEKIKISCFLATNEG